MALETTSALLVGQWATAPRLLAAVEAILGVLGEDVLPALERVHRMHSIDHAEGVWLDYLGARLGIRRPSTTDPSRDLRWGFRGPGQARGWDQVPMRGDEASAAVYALSDAVFRRFVRARSVLVLGNGTTPVFLEALHHIDPSATVEDHRDMTATVTTAQPELLALAEEIGALPRVAGVRVTVVEA